MPRYGLLIILALLGACTGEIATSAGHGDGGPSPDAAPSLEGGAPDAPPSPDGGPSIPDGAPSDAGAGADGSQTPGDGGAAVTLPAPDPAVVADAVSAALSSFHRNTSTGDIWCTPCDGAPVMLAAAAYSGDTSADARLLEQMRTLLGNGREPFGTGGYAANDERNATAMYAIARLIPRIWSQLTPDEVHLIDTIMKATLVASAYLTADATNVSSVPTGFDGSTNHDRDWNPNYREGMIGAVLVGAEYFGGQQATEALLDSYDHAAFTAELQSLGLDNLYWTFSTYQRSPGAGAPSPATVQQGLAVYRLYGMTLGQLLDIYLDLANDTFSEVVTCGLNDGAGILVGGVHAGRIVSGCAGLPNPGEVGMEKEFNSVDAEGQRSSAGYVRLGVRAHLFNHLVLLVYGDWQDTTASAAGLRRVQVGVTDFFYKAAQGYEGYSHAQDEGLFQCGADLDCLLNEAFWTQLIAPAHGL